MLTSWPSVQPHRAGRTGLICPSGVSVASGRNNRADSPRRRHLSRRFLSAFEMLLPALTLSGSFICELSRAAPPPNAAWSRVAQSPLGLLPDNLSTEDLVVLFTPAHYGAPTPCGGFPFFLKSFFSVSPQRVRSASRHAPTRARTGREGRATWLLPTLPQRFTRTHSLNQRGLKPPHPRITWED